MTGKMVAICIPSSEKVHLAFFTGYNALKKPEKFFTLTNTEKPLDVARNNLVKAALETGADYILFLNTDIVPPRDAVERLMAHNKDIVSGLYSIKQEPYLSLLCKKEGMAYKLIYDFKEGDLVEVDATGLGCMLIKCDVFEHLVEPYFKRAEFSEDYYFCEKAKDKDYQIYVDTAVQCDHLMEWRVNHDFVNNIKLKKRS